MSLWAKAGGEAGVRRVLEHFYAAVFADMMIGFHFRGSSRERLIERELELMSEALGGPLAYTGRAIDRAHRPHRIMGGHFDRRTVLLQESLDHFGVEAEVRAAWLAHNAALRSAVTQDGPGQCLD